MELKLIVRLTHNNYMHNGELVSKSRIKLLKRKSIGDLHDLIQDPDYDLAQLNLGKYDEGVYRLRTINESYDIESGYCDDWELALTPYEDSI